jgi:serine/threonine protein kinase
MLNQKSMATLSSSSSQEKTSEKPQPSSKSLFNFQYVIGVGGFGRVWKVDDKKSQKMYAMKEMSKALVITKKSVTSVMNERHLLS